MSLLLCDTDEGVFLLSVLSKSPWRPTPTLHHPPPQHPLRQRRRVKETSAPPLQSCCRTTWPQYDELLSHTPSLCLLSSKKRFTKTKLTFIVFTGYITRSCIEGWSHSHVRHLMGQMLIWIKSVSTLLRGSYSSSYHSVLFYGWVFLICLSPS